LGNTNEKDGGISITDKIADPKIAIRRRAKAKQGTCKIKIYNISNQEIEIPKDTIIAGIEECKYPKLEISINAILVWLETQQGCNEFNLCQLPFEVFFLRLVLNTRCLNNDTRNGLRTLWILTSPLSMIMWMRVYFPEFGENMILFPISDSESHTSSCNCEPYQKLA
jgi:hypothetical protein